MQIKEEIIKKLEEIVKKLTNYSINIELNRPNDSKNGDYATNIAMRLAKPLGKNPMEIAEEIVKELRFKIQDVGIEKVEAVKPGFINFYLSQEALQKAAEEILQHPEKAGTTDKIGQGRKAVVEYSSPNIAKPFTIGHLRSTIIGDAIANLLAAVGYEVYRDNHLGDWGTQFGKQIYAIKHWGSEETIEKSENPVKDLVALYVKFHEEAEKHPEIEDEARAWFKKLEDGDKEARRLWQKCIDWSWKEFARIYKELGVSFTENGGKGYGESYFEGKMQPIIEELTIKGLLKEDKGAKLVYFPEDKLPALMVIKADGATLYATRDLATDKFRKDHYGEDVLVVNEVGAEQSLYFKQLYETEYMLGWYKSGQRVHVGHGLYRFKEGKMSTRKGNTIWLEDVLNEAEERAKQLGSAEGTIAKQVAIGALKWNDLKRSAHMDVNFDWDEVLNMQGNSGPYVQYTYTRTQSVLHKVQQNDELRMTNYEFPKGYSPNEEELAILRMIFEFSETVEEAARTYSPNTITEYLFNLAQIFNNFYQKYRILNAGEQERDLRIALTAVVGIVIKQGLNLLGIQAPDKM